MKNTRHINGTVIFLFAFLLLLTAASTSTAYAADLTAPTIISANASKNSVTLKWNAVDDATAYRVLYKSGSSWRKLKDTTATSYVDSAVTTGQTRTYSVRCISKIGGDSVSTRASAVTAKHLASPTVRFYSKSGKITLKWDAIDGSEQYRIYRIDGDKRKKLGDTASNSYTVDAKSGELVRYAVRCVSEDGKNLQSSYLSVTGQYTAYTYREADRTVAGCGYFSKSGGLSHEQQAVLLRYMNAYYSATGSFENCTEGIFNSTALRNREQTLWNSVIAVRQKAIEDLSLKRYRFSLRVTAVEKISDTKLRVTLLEDSQLQFRDIPVLSYTYGNEHCFTLRLNSAGKWLISAHSSDCSPFYNFQYDEATQKDKLLNTALKQIDVRQATWGKKTGKTPACDHPYRRAAAKKYMMKWIANRNPNWAAYDANGGNCMNFASQVLYNGGIHKNKKWTWKSKWNCTDSWINVGAFTDYAAKATRKELHCNTTANYYTGDVGDLVLVGIKSPHNHATVISEVIRDDEGRTIDYLLCCNTTNLKNFPAAAYHYTNQHLIRIYGWDD